LDGSTPGPIEGGSAGRPAVCVSRSASTIGVPSNAGALEPLGRKAEGGSSNFSSPRAAI
jgi:hypothetical protein